MSDPNLEQNESGSVVSHTSGAVADPQPPTGVDSNPSPSVGRQDEVKVMDIGELLLPEWIKEVDPAVKAIVEDKHKMASLVGTMLGLLDYTRQNMSKGDWEYVLTALKKELHVES